MFALRVLYLVREEPKPIEGIIKGLGIPHLEHFIQSDKENPYHNVSYFMSVNFMLIHAIEDLVKLGLLEVHSGNKLVPIEDLRLILRLAVEKMFVSLRTKRKTANRSIVLFKYSDLANQLFQTLGLSLTELSEYSRTDSMIITPFFGKQSLLESQDKDSSDLFVLMPFAHELQPVYEDHIKKVAEGLKLRVRRGDDLFSKDSVMEDIWNAMNQARLIIADCTGRNPNVFYEIGIAHTINKPVILITQNGDDVPFDLRHLRYIKYEYTPRGMADFEEQLKQAISKILSAEASSYIWQRED